MYRGGFPSHDLPMVSWSEPPRDILELISDKLKEHRDLLLFSSVCVAWRSFILENLQRFPREQLPLSRCLPRQHQLPLLMLPSKDATKPCDFLCVFEQKIYGGTPMPDSNKWIWGSSKGWLVTVDIRRGSEIYLFNPISGGQIYLPSKTEITGPKGDRYQTGRKTFFHLRKAALSTSPGSNIEDCAVMAVISTACILCFCRPGDSKWTSVPDSPMRVDDIIYHKEQFYVVVNEGNGAVLACDIGPSPKVTAVVGGTKGLIARELWVGMIFDKRYLVESLGELLQVVKIVYADETDEDLDHTTIGFHVFKLEEKAPGEDNEEEQDGEYEISVGKFVPVKNSSYKWVKLDNLHDQVIFLGYNQSFSLPASALPNSRGNCIYFTNDHLDYHYGSLINGFERGMML